MVIKPECMSACNGNDTVFKLVIQLICNWFVLFTPSTLSEAITVFNSTKSDLLQKPDEISVWNLKVPCLGFIFLAGTRPPRVRVCFVRCHNWCYICNIDTFRLALSHSITPRPYTDMCLLSHADQFNSKLFKNLRKW